MNNSITNDLNRVITWQFDNAKRLVSIVELLKKFCQESTEKFWDDFARDVVDITTANDFGLSAWGNILGVKRPTLTIVTTEYDPNAYYSDDTGILRKVNSTFPYYTTPSGVEYYFKSDRYVLVPDKWTSGFYNLRVWDADRTSDFVSSNLIAIRSKLPLVDGEIVLGDEITFSYFKTPTGEKAVTINHNIKNVSTRECSIGLYRKLLIGILSLLCGNKQLGIVGNASTKDFQLFSNYVFGSGVSVVDDGYMSMNFVATGSLGVEEEALFNAVKDNFFIYPAGVKDNFLNGKMLAIPDNSSMTSDHTSLITEVSSKYPLAGKLDESSFDWNREHLEVE